MSSPDSHPASGPARSCPFPDPQGSPPAARSARFGPAVSAAALPRDHGGPVSYRSWSPSLFPNRQCCCDTGTCGFASPARDRRSCANAHYHAERPDMRVIEDSKHAHVLGRHACTPVRCRRGHKKTQTTDCLARKVPDSTSGLSPRVLRFNRVQAVAAVPKVGPRSMDSIPTSATRGLLGC